MTGPGPSISVVIPTYNRRTTLNATLDALSAQSLPPDRFEVVVIDDGSTDGTAGSLAVRRDLFTLRCVSQANAGQAVARNRGGETARGEILLFLDDDIGAELGMLAAHLETHQEHPGAVVLGHMDFEAPPDAGPLAERMASWWPEHYRRLAESPVDVSPTAAFSGNLSLPTAAFRHIGGFATDLPRSDDVELAHRLHEAGLRFVYTPAGASTQSFDKGTRAILIDAEREGQAAVTLLERYPKMLDDLRCGQLGTKGLGLRLAILGLARLPLRAGVVDALVGACPERWRGRVADVVYDSRYWRGLRRTVGRGDLWDRLVHPPLILMYHGFETVGGTGSRWIIPADRFAAHLDAIGRARFRVVPLGDLLEAVERGVLPPGRCVAITIDDGYEDVGTVAAPLLSERGMAASVYLVTGNMGGANEWDRDPPLRGRAILSWADAEALRALGVEAGGHSRSHAQLDLVDDERLDDEVAGCLDDLAAHLPGVERPVFAYPYGEVDDEARRAVLASGFRAGLGIRPGPLTPSSARNELPRNEIHGTWSARRLRVGLLVGDVDWVERLWSRARTIASPMKRRHLRR